MNLRHPTSSSCGAAAHHSVVSLALVCALACSCATLRPKTELTLAGDLDPGRVAAIVKRARQHSGAGVRVVDASTTRVDMTAHEIMGTVTLTYPTSFEHITRTLYWTNDYDSLGMGAYCNWQTPLKLLTVGLWAFVPFYWPCIADNPRGVWDSQERQDDLVRRVRPLAAEMGGDLAVLVRRRHDLAAMAVGTTHGRIHRSGSFSTVSLAAAEVSQVRNSGVTFVVLRRKSPTALPEATPAGR